VRRPLTLDLSKSLLVSMGPLYDRLPFELRRRTLELAFGNLQLHIFRGSARAPTKRSARSGSRKGKATAPLTQNKRWHYLCPRDMDEDWSNTLWLNNCHRQLDQDQVVKVGAMGWILTCRPA
jgi:hypothetical protein